MAERLNHGKHYSEKEMEYIIENLFYMPLELIARRIGRSPAPMAASLRIKGIKLYREVLDHYTCSEIASYLDVSAQSVSAAAREGRLNNPVYADAYMRIKLFSTKEIRKYVLNSDELLTRKHKCFHCGKLVRGDIYCPKHLPPEVGQLKPYSKDFINIKISDKKAMGAALRARRLELGLSGPQASELMGYDNSNLSRLERAERGFTFDNLHHTFNTLGCTVKIVIEKGPFVNGKAD